LQSLESLGPRLVVQPTVASVSTVELSPAVDVRASGVTASQEQQVVDEYYDRSVRSPQSLATVHTLRAESQSNEEAAEASTSAGVFVGSSPATALTGVPVQSVTTTCDPVSVYSGVNKLSAMPVSVELPVKTSPVVMSTTVQSSSTVVSTSVVASQTPPVSTSTSASVASTTDATTPGSAAVTVPVSIVETPTVAAAVAPVVIVRQLKEVRPYDGSTSRKSFR